MSKQNIKYFNNKKAKKKQKQEQTEMEMNKNLDKLPTLVQVQSIQKFIDSLNRKGKVIRDWDHKDKEVQMIKCIGGELYFLCESKFEEVQEYEEAFIAVRKDNALLAKQYKELYQENELLRKKVSMQQLGE